MLSDEQIATIRKRKELKERLQQDDNEKSELKRQKLLAEQV